jgi:hypothetical protein
MFWRAPLCYAQPDARVRSSFTRKDKKDKKDKKGLIEHGFQHIRTA